MEERRVSFVFRREVKIVSVRKSNCIPQVVHPRWPDLQTGAGKDDPILVKGGVVFQAMGTRKRGAILGVPSTRKRWTSDRDVRTIVTPWVLQRSQSQLGLDRFI